MNNNWKYKIDLKDESVFDVLATTCNALFPQDLRSFIIEHNAACPEKNRILIDNSERIFETVLSFNKYEAEATSVFAMIGDDSFNGLIPFGLDPFGNVFCYSVSDGIVVYWEHEENISHKTNHTLNSFIDNLY